MKFMNTSTEDITEKHTNGPWEFMAQKMTPGLKDQGESHLPHVRLKYRQELARWEKRRQVEMEAHWKSGAKEEHNQIRGRKNVPRAEKNGSGIRVSTEVEGSHQPC